MGLSVATVLKGIQIWKAIRPIQRWKARRARKLAEEAAEEAVEDSELSERKEVEMKKWYQSLTIKGLGVTVVGFALGWIGVGDAESAALAERLLSSVNELIQISGILIAAWGRKRAKGPLTK